jgi:hypothetical protein
VKSGTCNNDEEKNDKGKDALGIQRTNFDSLDGWYLCIERSQSINSYHELIENPFY